VTPSLLPPFEASSDGAPGDDTRDDTREENRMLPRIAVGGAGPRAAHTRVGGPDGRLDVDTVKRRHSIADVAAGYGLEARPVGRVWMAVCPFHDDHQPSLLLDPRDGHFHCFSGRCGAHGDVIDLVRRLEGVGFKEAVARLAGPLPHPGSSTRAAGRLGPPGGAGTAAPAPRRPQRARRPPGAAGPAERACLAAAVELYANGLLADPAALGYVEGRGLRRATIERCHVGYARGDELAPYLRWRGLPLPAARRAGLLRADGTDVLAGRIVVPELRAGRPVWLVGRAIGGSAAVPKYLGLAGEKPLLGWEWAGAAPWPLDSAVPPGVLVVEGPFDWLTLVQWGLPAVALVGTHVRREVLRDLARIARPYVLLDDDEAGRAAAGTLCRRLGPGAVVAALDGPVGAKDVSDLAPHPGGRDILARALERAGPPATEHQPEAPLRLRPPVPGAHDSEEVALREQTSEHRLREFRTTRHP
jgi:DNA primase